jgi:hypothetical protein
VRSREHAGQPAGWSSPAHARSAPPHGVAMLRIERAVHGAVVVFTMSGRVGPEHITELQRVLDSEAAEQKALNLKDVILVDRDAVRFLARSEAEGTALENCPIYIREWIVREAELK